MWAICYNDHFIKVTLRCSVDVDFKMVISKTLHNFAISLVAFSEIVTFTHTNNLLSILLYSILEVTTNSITAKIKTPKNIK